MNRIQKTLRQKNTFRPRYEALEDRTVPAATATFAGGVINIAGTNKVDNVQITDAGNTVANGQVIVRVEGVQVLAVDAKTVTGINFQMGKKNDNVTYTLTGTLAGAAATGGTRTITGDLGKGNDTFSATAQQFIASGLLSMNVQGKDGKDTMTLNMNGDIFGTGRLDCTFDGGKGKDILTVNSTTGTPLAGPGVELGIGTQMNVNLLGGKDKDTMTMNYAGDMDGALTFAADGAKGKDTINANFQLAAGSGFLINPGNATFPLGIPLTTPASLKADIFGGPDKDNLTLVVNKLGVGGNITINATVNGGPANDTISTAGSNVPVTVIQ